VIRLARLRSVLGMPGSAKESTPRSRLWARLSVNPSGAISGTIVAMAVIAAADPQAPAGAVLAATVGTLLVFWLTHVYPEVLAQRLHNSYDLSSILGTMARQLPMLEAPALSVLFVCLAALGLVDQGLAVSLALSNGVGQLFGWGVIVGRRLGWSWPAALLAGAVDGTLGLVIVGLKVLLQH